jgi:hypothetical protein
MLRLHYLRREPKFVLDPARRHLMSARATELYPSAAPDAARRADRVVDGRYDLLGYFDLSFDCGSGAIDWHCDPVHARRAPECFWASVPYLSPRIGDHKVIWELNRHQHWLKLGRAAWLTSDPRYPAAFANELHSWMVANPPLRGINWSSMLELAFRSISWVWALHFFAPFDALDETPWLVDLLLGLDSQLDHAARHLSFYFSPNTHLLGEALALYVAGRTLPELRSAARWANIGRRILLHEAQAQINRDGGHAELSTHYHRYALDFYLLALAIARRTKDPAANPFSEVTSRLASFCRAMAADDGRLPTIGDDDGGQLFPMCGRAPADASDSLALAAALLDRSELAVGDAPEEVFWMLGGSSAAVAAGPLAQLRSHFFRDSGYAAIRSPDAHAIFDTGPHGFLNGGHAHADALSVVLSMHGRPLLVDPGTATYTMDPLLRDRFRSTVMHNTVVIDGRPQSAPSGPFQWASRAQGHMGLWHPAPRFDYAEAWHDGYLPLVHRRGLLHLHDGLYLIADHILGTGHHQAEGYWHLDPAWALDASSIACARLSHPDGLSAVMASSTPGRQEFRGDPQGFGWCSPVYGQLVPSLTLRFSQAAQLPMSLVTAIAVSPSRIDLSLESAAVHVEVADHWHRTAVSIAHGEARLVAIFATPAWEGRPNGSSGTTDATPWAGQTGEQKATTLAPRSIQRVSAGDGLFTTDARVAVFRLSGSGYPLSLVLVHATAAAWTGTGPFRLAGLDPAGDLHLDGTALQQLSSRPDTGLPGQD